MFNLSKYFKHILYVCQHLEVTYRQPPNPTPTYSKHKTIPDLNRSTIFVLLKKFFYKDAKFEAKLTILETVKKTRKNSH